MKQMRQIDIRAIDLEALGVQIAYVTTDSPEHRDVCRRNARRIATADEMFDAIQAIVDWCDKSGQGEALWCVQLARTALAKALCTNQQEEE